MNSLIRCEGSIPHQPGVGTFSIISALIYPASGFIKFDLPYPLRGIILEFYEKTYRRGG
jgi:hypothetical protein